MGIARTIRANLRASGLRPDEVANQRKYYEGFGDTHDRELNVGIHGGRDGTVRPEHAIAEYSHES
jgi:hypothetical protein